MFESKDPATTWEPRLTRWVAQRSSASLKLGWVVLTVGQEESWPHGNRWQASILFVHPSAEHAGHVLEVESTHGHSSRTRAKRRIASMLRSLLQSRPRVLPDIIIKPERDDLAAAEARHPRLLG